MTRPKYSITWEELEKACADDQMSPELLREKDRLCSVSGGMWFSINPENIYTIILKSYSPIAILSKLCTSLSMTRTFIEKIRDAFDKRQSEIYYRDGATTYWMAQAVIFCQVYGVKKSLVDKIVEQCR